MKEKLEMLSLYASILCVNIVHCQKSFFFLTVHVLYVLIGLKIVIYLYFIHYIFHFCYLKRRHNGTHEIDVCFAIRLLRIIRDKTFFFKSTIVDDYNIHKVSTNINVWYGQITCNHNLLQNNGLDNYTELLLHSKTNLLTYIKEAKLIFL